MIVIIETFILCIVFFMLCYLGTGTDEKNLKSYSSYPDEYNPHKGYCGVSRAV